MEVVEFLRAWGWALAIAANLLTGWIGWSLRRQFVTRSDHERSVKERNEALASLREAVQARGREIDGSIARAMERLVEQDRLAESRLTRVEEQLRAAPSHADLSRIHERLDKIADVTGRLEGALQPLDRLLGLLTRAAVEKEGAKP